MNPLHFTSHELSSLVVDVVEPTALLGGWEARRNCSREGCQGSTYAACSMKTSSYHLRWKTFPPSSAAKAAPSPACCVVCTIIYLAKEGDSNNKTKNNVFTNTASCGKHRRRENVEADVGNWARRKELLGALVGSAGVAFHLYTQTLVHLTKILNEGAACVRTADEKEKRKRKFSSSFFNPNLDWDKREGRANQDTRRASSCASLMTLDVVARCDIFIRRVRWRTIAKALQNSKHKKRNRIKLSQCSRAFLDEFIISPFSGACSALLFAFVFAISLSFGFSGGDFMFSRIFLPPLRKINIDWLAL